MFSIFFTFFLVIFFCNLIFVDYFLVPSPYTIVRHSIWKSLSDRTLYYNLFASLFLFILVINVAGNIPGLNIPNLYYFFTASISFVVWVALMVVVFNTQLIPFLAHILPYGSPVGLMLFLPIVEIFSHLIRPFTLIVRLRTNLSSGHIMLYMFSFFSVHIVFAGPFVILVYLLMLLEVMISILQAYIFASLSYMYISETLWVLILNKNSTFTLWRWL